MNRAVAYERRGLDPEFSAAWDDALEQSTDALAGEAYRRAHGGTEKPVFYQGEECGRVREYSDTLAIFLLKAHRPGVYGDRIKHHHDFSKLSDAELIERAKGLAGGVAEAGPDPTRGT